MATQSLKRYLERRRKVRRPSTRSSSFSNAAAEKARKRNILAREASNESIEQHARVPSLIVLWRKFEMDPYEEFFPTFEALHMELVELEQNYDFTFLNPRVVTPSTLATKHALLAGDTWSKSFENARAHAREAIILKLRSLIEGYRTVAGRRIITSREFIEAQLTVQSKLFLLHEEARSYFREARGFQKSRNFCDAKNQSRARRLFRKAIFVTEEIFLTGYGV